jgi:hypothetical protein
MSGAGGGGRTLTSLCRPYGFSCHFGFRRRHRRSWSGLSLHRPDSLRGGAARLVSTPSRRKPSVRAWLGIAISGFPDFGQFCIAGFPGEHSSSPQVRCVCQFRHTRVADHRLLFMIGQPQELGSPNSRLRPGAVLHSCRWRWTRYSCTLPAVISERPRGPKNGTRCTRDRQCWPSI